MAENFPIPTFADIDKQVYGLKNNIVVDNWVRGVDLVPAPFMSQKGVFFALPKPPEQNASNVHLFFLFS